jgi:hypothetical protein
MFRLRRTPRRRVGRRSRQLRRDAAELVEKYPPGAEVVTVYYNPTHCATAVLGPRSLKHAVGAAVMAVGFGFFALAFVAIALRVQ